MTVCELQLRYLRCLKRNALSVNCDETDQGCIKLSRSSDDRTARSVLLLPVAAGSTNHLSRPDRHDSRLRYRDNSIGRSVRSEVLTTDGARPRRSLAQR
jgi:hypothetical protein